MTIENERESSGRESDAWRDDEDPDGRARMLTIVLLVLIAAIVAALSPSLAAAQTPVSHVAEPATRVVLRQRLAAVVNPVGLEHQMELALRSPTGDPSSPFFVGSHVEIGAVTMLSPMYAMGGGYLDVAPLSFLSLRVQVVGQGVWPLGLSGTGYYALDDYDADTSSQALPGDGGEGASGYRASVSATLRGAIPLGGLTLFALDTVTLEYAKLGDADYYYDQRSDFVRARSGLLVTSNAIVGATLALDTDLHLTLGAFDDFRNVPSAGHVANQVGPIASLEIARPSDTIAFIHPFLRAGYYTHHPERDGGVSMLGGVALEYDLRP